MGNRAVHEVSAGGIVFRKSERGAELLLIRDRFGRWSFPKGLVDPGERPEETALREIKEETGVEGEVVEKLGQVRYFYRNVAGALVAKRVDYFLVRATGGEVSPQRAEIEEAAWFPPDEALRLSSYANMAEVLRKAISAVETG